MKLIDADVLWESLTSKYDEVPEWSDIWDVIEALPPAVQNCVLCKYYTEIETADGIKGRCTRKGSDLISRQDAIRIVDQFSREEMFHYMESLELDVRATQICHSAIEAVGTIKEQIESLPSTEPKTRWIPCSERLPEDDEIMFVTYMDKGEPIVWLGWHEMENVWFIDGNEHSEERGGEVIAWMPLPEDYEGEKHEID